MPETSPVAERQGASTSCKQLPPSMLARYSWKTVRTYQKPWKSAIWVPEGKEYPGHSKIKFKMKLLKFNFTLPTI